MYSEAPNLRHVRLIAEWQQWRRGVSAMQPLVLQGRQLSQCALQSACCTAYLQCVLLHCGCDGRRTSQAVSKELTAERPTRGATRTVQFVLMDPSGRTYNMLGSPTLSGTVRPRH